MTRTVSRAPLFLYLFGFALIGLSSAALANKVTWEFHKSITGAFDVRFPAKYKMKSIPLRIDEKTVLFRNEILANVGEGPDGKENMKVFLVKVDQSLASRLRSKDITKLLEIDSFRYKKSAQNAGGQVVTNTPVNADGFKGRELYITYGSNDNKQGIRVKIMYTDVSRVEMVLTGPASSMYAFKSNDFFNSLKLYDGPGKIDGQLGENWVDYESPLGLFTLRLPPEQNSFVSGAPKFIHESKKERGRFVFIDPLLEYKTFFNFYGYKIDEQMNFDKVKALLLSAHISQYADKIRMDDLKIDTKTSEDGSHGIVSTLVRMRPLEKYPYINTILIQAVFNDQGVVVLEFLGSHIHVDTPLSRTVFSLVKFHPDKYTDDRASTAGVSGDDKSLEDDEGENPDEAGVSGDGEQGDDDEAEAAEESGRDAGQSDATSLKANIKIGATGDTAEPQKAEGDAAPDASAEAETAPQTEDAAQDAKPDSGQAPAESGAKPAQIAPAHGTPGPQAPAAQ